MFYNGLVNLLAVILFWSAPSKSFSWTPDSGGRHQIELWLDPYYSAVNCTKTLADGPIAKLVSDGERDTDWWLFQHVFQPRDLLVEASINPLPVGGWAVRKWAPELYHDARVKNVHLVKALTEGFPEPWAASVFWGNVVNLVRGEDTAKVNGTAYSGFLLSWSRWNLLDNHLVKGDWIESELKIKGDDLRSERRMGWSFRAGWREHLNPDIHSYFYGSLKRSRTDFKYSGWNPMRNSSVELRMDLDRERFPQVDLLRWFLILGKKFPFRNGTMAWSVYGGLVDEVRSGYSPHLQPIAPKGLKVILQPDLEW